MNKRDKIILVVALVFIGIGGIGLVSYIYRSEILKKWRPSVAGLDDSLWEVALEDINNVWNGRFDLGDSHFQKNCPQLVTLENEDSSGVGQLVKGCREELFHCYYHKRKVKLAFKNKRYPMTVNFDANSKNQITVEVGSETKDFKLSDHCRMTKLPDGFYRARFLDKDYDWHTSGIHYYVDRYLVRNLDVALWKNEALKKEPFAPSTQLTSSEMADYCASRNAQVLSAKIFDAFTFHHGRESIEQINQVAPGKNISPYPFGARLIDSPNYYAKKGEKSADKKTCEKIYSQECLKIDSQDSLYSVGWSEVTELLGGPLEYVINTKYPRKNLIASSYYFPLGSTWHKAGKRAYWSGADHHIKDFNFFVEAPKLSDAQKKNLAVGFRCMRLEWP